MIKKILSYTILFVQCILLLFLTLLVVAKFTVFSDSYVRRMLTKNDYYSDLYDEIYTEMSYYTNQSGFDDSILKDIFTIGEVKFETNRFIENVYKGKSVKIDVTNMNKRLQSNIDDYISNSSFEYVDKKEIDNFIEAMDEVYSDEIKLMGYVEKISPLFYKGISYSNKLLIVLSVLFILLVLLNQLKLKNKNIGVMLLFVAFALIYGIWYTFGNIDIKNIFIYSKLVSDMAKSVIYSIRNILIIISVLFVVLTIMLGLIKNEKKS